MNIKFLEIKKLPKINLSNKKSPKKSPKKSQKKFEKITLTKKVKQ
tara:strand:+ start:229 stop:363 length:135 start_codon:yes stop_codon:yes gene_type:complete